MIKTVRKRICVRKVRQFVNGGLLNYGYYDDRIEHLNPTELTKAGINHFNFKVPQD